MALKNFNVTLDPEIVERARGISMGSRLSPILNNLLKIWIEERETVEKLMIKIYDDKLKQKEGGRVEKKG